MQHLSNIEDPGPQIFSEKKGIFEQETKLSLRLPQALFWRCKQWTAITGDLFLKSLPH